MDNKAGHKEEEEEKENHFMALLFATLFSLLVGWFAKRVFLRWCKDNDLTGKEGLILLFVCCWLLGLVLMVLAYLIALVSLLFS